MISFGRCTSWVKRRSILATTAYIETITIPWRPVQRSLSIPDQPVRDFEMTTCSCSLIGNLQASRAFLGSDNAGINPDEISQEGASLKCDSRYEALGLILPVLCRVPFRAATRIHYLPSSILSPKFGILVVGKKPKKENRQV